MVPINLDPHCRRLLHAHRLARVDVRLRTQVHHGLLQQLDKLVSTCRAEIPESICTTCRFDWYLDIDGIVINFDRKFMENQRLFNTEYIEN